jgi:hypothetical protein
MESTSPILECDVDVSVRFKPMSGREDASGGIVLRFADGRYYVVRANALENNFRLYYYAEIQPLERFGHDDARLAGTGS